ncbi:glycosyltransferase family 2 protein [Psychrobacillus sp. NPDC093180]|uniref:glycosyltransferase family 2 protein n=1 Tax=Psychrobacillus sp. NPDC093180 TaxID=3364489 RepID=UPI00381E572F
MYKKVSVLMTVYNDGNRYLEQSILSILNQTYQDFEFVIVNDGSTDNSSEIINTKAKKDERIVFVNRSKNMGRSYSLNEGLSKCTGDFIFINDADDISDVQRIYTSLDYFDKNIKDKDKFGLLGTAFKTYHTNKGDKTDHYLKYGILFKNKFPMWRLFIGMPFPHSSIMYSKKALDKVGGFSTEVSSGIDYLTLLKIANNNAIYGINQILVERVVDGNNFFMQKKISEINERNKEIIEKWEKENVKLSIFHGIPTKIYDFIKKTKKI